MKTLTIILPEYKGKVLKNSKGYIVAFPEQTLTPNGQVKWTKTFCNKKSWESSPEDLKITLITSSPYIVRALTTFGENKFKFLFSDGREIGEDAEIIYKPLAAAMRNLMMYSLGRDEKKG